MEPWQAGLDYLHSSILVGFEKRTQINKVTTEKRKSSGALHWLSILAVRKTGF